MGQARLEITAVGGHGCQREVKDGGLVGGCGRLGCFDCEAFSLVAEFARRTGANVEGAKLTHWPGTAGEVVDTMKPHAHLPLAQHGQVPRLRAGSF